jgi:hypothetical protein
LAVAGVLKTRNWRGFARPVGRLADPANERARTFCGGVVKSSARR